MVGLVGPRYGSRCAPPSQQNAAASQPPRSSPVMENDDRACDGAGAPEAASSASRPVRRRRHRQRSSGLAAAEVAASFLQSPLQLRVAPGCGSDWSAAAFHPHSPDALSPCAASASGYYARHVRPPNWERACQNRSPTWPGRTCTGSRQAKQV